MSFLRRVAGLSLRDRVGSSVIREELGVDPLLLRVERIPQEELDEVAGEREVWASLLRLLPPATQPQISRKKMDGWMENNI
ncbi:hypothetical protein N1851_029236 [Merluccius polli]|uniref:Uncharacterized protein n=1 Tax=Merluccius polli TaxID=89951 RepID=A0AA47NQV4_MERPO|nr:hypothetical protein N1851_029236 [Merluccius polli]